MFSWIEPIVENAKQEMDDAIAEMTGEEIPEAPVIKEETDSSIHYPFHLPITYQMMIFDPYLKQLDKI